MQPIELAHLAKEVLGEVLLVAPMLLLELNANSLNKAVDIGDVHGGSQTSRHRTQVHTRGTEWYGMWRPEGGQVWHFAGFMVPQMLGNSPKLGRRQLGRQSGK